MVVETWVYDQLIKIDFSFHNVTYHIVDLVNLFKFMISFNIIKV